MSPATTPVRTLRAALPAAAPRRDLVLATTAVVALSRFAEGPALWLVAVLVTGALLLAVLQILAESQPDPELGIPIESLLTPAVAGFAAVGAMRLVPVGLALVPALLAFAFILDRTVRTEARLLTTDAPTEAQRARVLVEAVVVGFLAFLGVAALVPGGLPEPGGTGGGLSNANLVLLAAVDAVIAGLLGYRASALRVPTLGDALWSAATYAIAIAVAAAAVRAMDVPRLVGPAMLILVFFLWDAFHGAPPARRRDPRWIWQTVLLVALGVVVVAWNLGLR